MPAYQAETLIAIDAVIVGGTRRIERQRMHITDMAQSGSDTLGAERRLIVMEADLRSINRIRSHVMRGVV